MALSSRPDRGRVFVEGAVIVASILLAFAIDAWWDDRSAVRVESAMLGAVADELARNRDELHQNVLRLESNLDRVDRFLRMSDQDLLDLPRDSIGLWLSALNSRASFNGDTEATLMLLRSAPLDSRESLAIRSRLARWQNTVDEAELLGLQLDQSQIRVEEMLARYAVEIGSGGLDGVPEMAARSGARGLSEVRRDEALVAAIIAKAASQSRHLMFLRRLSDLASDLTEQVRELAER